MLTGIEYWRNINKITESTCSSDGQTKCLNTFSGYKCGCGNCYNEFEDKTGVKFCKPKCDLSQCDEGTGICEATSGEAFLACHIQ